MKQILVVDDDEQVCSFIRDSLEAIGKYVVISANTGRAGLKAVWREKSMIGGRRYVQEFIANL